MKHFDSLAQNLMNREDWDSHVYSAVVNHENHEVLWETAYCYHVDDLQSWELEHWEHKGQPKYLIQVEDEQRNGQNIRTPLYGIKRFEEKERKPIIGLAEGNDEKAAVFNQEMLSIPLHLDEMPLRSEFWQLYDYSSDLLKQMRFKIAFLDLSMGERDSDYQSLVVAGVKDNNFYVLDGTIERRSLVTNRQGESSLAHLIRVYCELYQVDALFVENNGFQALYLNELQTELETNYTDKSKIPPIIGHRSTTNKHERIKSRLAIFMAKGRIYVRRDWRDECKSFMQNVNDFPKSTHDDAPDVLDMAIGKLLNEM